MANSYVYNINSLMAYPHYEGESTVVFSVFFTCSGTDGKGHNAAQSAPVDVGWKQGDPFTPYEKLTQAQVVGWVKDILGPEGMKEIEASIDALIADEINPPVVTPPLPWAS